MIRRAHLAIGLALAVCGCSVKGTNIAPVAIISGSTPRMKANDVIRIGRKRVRAASVAAW